MNSCKDRSFVPPFTFTSRPHSLKTLTAFLTRLVETREERDSSGFFYADGLRAVNRILETRHFSPELFVYSPEILSRHPMSGPILERIRARHPTIPLVTLPASVIMRLSVSPEPQGIGILMRQVWTPLYRLPPEAGLCYLALDTVRNAGNLGTVLRTLEAVGGAGLLCLPPDDCREPTIDPFAPNVVRAAMGATFTLRFARTGGEEWERWRKKHNVLLVGTSPHTGDDYRTVGYGQRVVLWMGGERKGLSEGQMAMCDRLVRIPMSHTAMADSLNLATATSILLYELFNQVNPTS